MITEVDNSYISSGRYFAYRDAKKDPKKLKTIDEVLKEFPILEARVKHLDSRIAETDSIKYKRALLNSEKYKMVTSEAMEVALDILRDEFQIERSKLLAQIKDAKR